MSKTDKDRPAWVQNLEHGLIDHDHRHGVCIVGSGHEPRWSHHYITCKKREVVEFTCTRKEPYESPYRFSPSRCWIYDLGAELWSPCAGHRRVEWHEEIPCSCDDKPAAVTCTPTWVYGRCWSGGIPSAFVRSYYHKPERARERRLRELAREYNTYGDLEDEGDYVNRQGRGSMRWLYW
jgi:hypothetical protein